MPRISTYKELRVYQTALDAAQRIFELTKSFPVEERYSMTDQIRRASRSVCENLGEAWRRRRYKRHFISKKMNAKVKQKRREYGWNYLSVAATSPKSKL